jgi:DNA (cytosine-5)-methyltransferase 1
MIRFVDLFAGVGGLRLAFEQAMTDLGLSTECVLASEIDPQARETYRLNYGHFPSGDVREINDVPQFDFLLAGFPCQPFSYAGKQKGFADTRGTLFFEIERILKDNRPGGFILENVRGLTTHDGGRTFESILQHLRDLNYGVSYLVLNSSSFGVPQNRVRVYILGLDQSVPRTSLKSDFGAADSHKYKTEAHQANLFVTENPATVSQILEDSPDEKYNCTEDFTRKLARVLDGNFSQIHGCRLIDYRNGKSIHSWQLGVKGYCSDDEIAFMDALIANRRRKEFGVHQDGKRLGIKDIRTFYDHPRLLETIGSLKDKGYLSEIDGKYNPVAGNMSFEVFKFLDPDSISITLVTSDAHKLGVFHNRRLRRITPRECARLQGFPDTFTLHPSDTFAYRQMGNSVSVPVVREVLLDMFNNSNVERVIRRDKMRT